MKKASELFGDVKLEDLPMTMFSKIKYFFRNKKYDVYCPYCSSCGETGCCSPTSCINHKKGFYCQTNQDALKVSYWTLKEFWNELDEKKYPEIEQEISEIHTKHYNEQYQIKNELQKRNSRNR